MKQLEKFNANIGILARKIERVIELLDDVKDNSREMKKKIGFSSGYIQAIWIILFGILVYLILA